jgi:hypothetical protein
MKHKKRLLQNESFAAAIFFCVYVRKCGKTISTFSKNRIAKLRLGIFACLL